MQAENITKRNIHHVEIYKIFFAPIVLLLGLVPLLTRLQVIEADVATQSILQEKQIFDFFSQYKAHIIIILGAVMLVSLMLIIGWNELKKSKCMWIYYICLGIYLMMTALSTFCSEQRHIAMWGMADRAEGLIMILCYGVMFFYSIYIINREADYKYIAIPLIILTIIMGIIGFFQYIGYDLFFTTEIGKSLLVPEEYAVVRDHIQSTYESKRIHGTMYHYNYMGSFTAMMIPFFGVLAVFIKNKNRIVYGITLLVSLFLLFGSTSRAGIIGVVCSLIVGVILFAKGLFKNMKIVGVGFGVIVIFIMVLNLCTKGSIFERVPLLINDIKAMMLPVEEDYDYRDHLPLRNIQTIENSIELELSDSKLIIEVTPYDIHFKDEIGNVLEFNRTEEGYQSEDAKYQGFKFMNKRVGTEETRDYVEISYNRLLLFIVEVNTEQGAYLVDAKNYEPLVLDEPETFGFKGKEKLGSARGYIWSRSLPMLKETLILGYGPDNYPLHFPQNDLFGKWSAYGTPYMIVDKPHNLYLQIAINQGCIALIAFLGIVGFYIWSSIKLYIGKTMEHITEIIGSACVMAVAGYLGAGLFNDSVVSVAPIFWVLLGFGIATNEMVACSRKRALNEL